MDMLVAATGVHRGSLYGTFGSKRGLFLAALRQAFEVHGADDEIVLVALFDLAPRDDEIRALLAEVIPAGGGELGARLLRRAGL